MSGFFLDLSYTSMMRLLSFVGRVFFAAIFIQSAYTEFVNWGVEGPEAMAVRPKLDQITARLSLLLGYAVPQIKIKYITGITIALKGLGGLLFIYGSSTGACLLMLYLEFISPMMYDFYNYDIEEPEFFQVFAIFTQNLALFGALLFFIGLNNRTPKRQPKKKGAPRSKKAAPARNHG